MKIIKGLVLGLLCFLLFLSLSTFGLAFMLNKTLLNPDFVTAEVDRLDVPSLVEEVLSEPTPSEEFAEELRVALLNTITELEPSVKEQVSIATHSIYDYLLGKEQGLDLAHILRGTLLTTDFMVSLVDNIDISPLAKEFINKQLVREIPDYMKKYLLESLDKAIIELKPWIKNQVSAAADPVWDYLLGENRSLNVLITLEPAKESLRNNVMEAFLKSPPPELAGASQAELEQYFNQGYQKFAGQIPSTIEIDEGLFGTEIPAQIAEALAEAEDGLSLARQYIGYFQLGYKLLIGFILLLILGIILISREVRDITRRLGITFLTYGAFEYAGIFIAKHFAGTWLPLSEMPSSLQTWLPQFLDNLLAPLQIFSLGLLIGGIVLIIVSLVYKPPPSSP